MSGVLCVELDFHYFIETSEEKTIVPKNVNTYFHPRHM